MSNSPAIKWTLLFALLLILAVAALLWLRQPTEAAMRVWRLGGQAYYSQQTNLQLPGWVPQQTSVKLRLEKMSSVDLEGAHILDADISSLILDDVDSLSLKCPSLTSRAMEKITTLKNLEDLFIPTENVTDEWVPMISRIIGLKHLNLDHSQVTDKSVKALCSLKKLRTISVCFTQISKGGAVSLIEAESLDHLYVSSDQLSEELIERCQQKKPKVFLEVDEENANSK